MRVLLVDDHTIIRQALTAVLSPEPDVEIVGEAATGLAAVEQTQALRNRGLERATFATALSAAG